MRIIDADAAIDAVHTATYGFICGAEDGDEMTDADKLVLSINKAVCGAVKALPTTQPEQRWISIKWHNCTDEEREEYGFVEEVVAVFDCDMPNDNQEILVTTSHGYVEKDVCYIDDGYSLDSGNDWIEDIIAWMPLPEPYKGGQDETN